MHDQMQRNRKICKQWLRRFLALLLGVILFSEAGATLPQPSPYGVQAKDNLPQREIPLPDKNSDSKGDSNEIYEAID